MDNIEIAESLLIILATAVIFVNTSSSNAAIFDMQYSIKTQQLANLNCVGFYESADYKEGRWMVQRHISVSEAEQEISELETETLDKNYSDALLSIMKTESPAYYHRKCMNYSNYSTKWHQSAIEEKPSNFMQIAPFLLLGLALIVNISRSSI